MSMKNGLIKGNEELNKQLLNNEKNLLKERNSLRILYEETKIEIFDVEEQIQELHLKNKEYKDYKKDLIGRFLINIVEMLVVFGIFAAVPNILFNLSAEFAKVLYIVLGISFVSIDSLLFWILKSEIKDYIKNEDVNDFNGKNIAYLEENREALEEQVKEINQQLVNTENKLNKMHNAFMKRGIVSPRNNEYSNDENVKSKQKIIEK
ncbi:MAG: hypothetical protein E7157_03080 [Lactobacillales bacterium]|nr:hypothetical protein [Lactobacillales bacterium]